MINLLMGPPGGGKSYEAVVYHILVALNRGRKVITNLPLNLDEIELACPGARELIDTRKAERFDGVLVRPFAHVNHYGDDWRHPETGSGALYVIDECHKAIPLRGTPIDIEEWYAEHRHELCDVLLITQSYGKINKAIRDSVQVVYRCRKATALGSNTRYIRKVQDGLRGEVTNESIRAYEPKYFRFYSSHTKSGAGQELAASDIRPIWSHWSFRGAAICALLVVGLSIYNTTKPKKTAPPPKVETVSVQSDPVVTSEPVQIDAKPRGPEQKLHPYQGSTLHLQALVKGKRFREGVEQDYLNGYVVVAQNGQPITRVSLDDLRETGYQIAYQSSSVISLTYQGFDIGYVIADIPQVSMAPKAAKDTVAAK